MLVLRSSPLACSWLRDGQVREIEKEQTRKLNGRKLGRGRAARHWPLFPDHGLLFRLPFSPASSLLSESLFQALPLLMLLQFICHNAACVMFICQHICPAFLSEITFSIIKKSNPVNTGTDGTCHSVRIKRINFRESI